MPQSSKWIEIPDTLDRVTVLKHIHCEENVGPLTSLKMNEIYFDYVKIYIYNVL